VLTLGAGYTSTSLVTIAPPPGENSYVTYWSNDGTSVAGGEPSASVSVAVSDGLFTVDLGDTTVPNMMAIAASLFTQTNLQLRIWFTDGVNGWAALSPVQNLTQTPYAVNAQSASVLLGTLPTSQLSGTLGNAQLSNSTITVSAGAGLSGGGVAALGGSTTLNNAGVLSVVGTDDITASTVAGVVTLGDNATSNALVNTIVKRDGSGNFSAGTITLTGTLNMANTAGNTVVGSEALSNNTTGLYNTANGILALYGNLTGSFNTANGADALEANTSGSNNTANGVSALHDNLAGVNNTANGANALYGNMNGSYNMADGVGALENCTTGSNNIGLGYEGGVQLMTGSYNIEIGNVGTQGDNQTIRIGTQGAGMGQTNTYIAGISGVTVTGAAVYVNSSGQLGVLTSSGRFKQGIQSMGDASDAILALRPVTFRYRPELDPTGAPQFGLIAEEVNKVDPDLVLRDDHNQIYTVRYEAVNAMLLNEFLKQHQTVQEQSGEIAALRQQNAALAQQFNELAAAVKSLAEKNGAKK
jgi:hypothetical protein